MTTEVKELASELSQEFCRLYPREAAAAIAGLAPDEIVDFLTRSTTANAARVMERLSPDIAARALSGMEIAVAGKVLEALDVPAAAHLVARLPAAEREPLLAQLQPGAADELRQLISYPLNTAAALMDPEVLALEPETTVQEALKRLRVVRHKRIHRVYLIAEDRHLLGSVSIRDLALADPSTPLNRLDVMPPNAAQAMATHEEVVEVLARNRVSSLPVVDFHGRLLGVLRQDALEKVTREDATVNMQSMVGAGKEERALSSVGLAVRKRLPWLQINLVTAFLAASVVGLFESTIARYTALAVLLPVVAGQSGNTGAQALAVTMRGLALREVRTRQWFRVCFKETKVGAVNGIAVAITTMLGVLAWSRSFGLALVIGSSMVIAMIAAGLSGSAVPMILTALKQDPAQSSSIILTTITDVVGFFSFLGIATLLMGLL